MERIISARVDESVAHLIGSLARDLGKSKKSVIEEAIRAYSAGAVEAQARDVFEETFGAWKRKESPAKTVERAKKAFHESMTRRLH